MLTKNEKCVSKSVERIMLKCSDQVLNLFLLKYRKRYKSSVNDYKANILKTTTWVKRKIFPVIPQVSLCVLSPP